MRKFSIALLALLMLLLGTLTSAAKTSEELSDLARYYPANAPAFAAIRTDAAFIDELGSLMQLLDGKLNGAFGGMTLRDVLDQASQNVDRDGDFATTFAWLGETAAVGITDPDFQSVNTEEEDQAVLIAFAVTDSAAAESFLDILHEMAYVKEEVDGGFLYYPENPDDEDNLQVFAESPTLFLGEDVLLVRPSSFEPESIIPANEENLADNPDFQAAMQRLPLEDYNAIAYVDPMILEAELEESLAESPMPMMMNPLAILEAIGPQSAGFRLVDERNLVADVAVNIADMAAFEAAGGRLRDAEPIDLSFANNLPATTALFFQDTGLGIQIAEGLVQMEALGDFYDEALENGELDFDQQDLTNLDEAAVFLRQTFEGLSSLTLQEAFGWMTGDYIAFLNINEGISEEIPALPDFGLLVEVTDNAAADALLSAAPEVLEQLGLDYVDENGLIVMPVLGDMVQSHDMDIIIGNNGSVFALGTRPTTEAVLNGEGGLADTEAFQYASQYFLPDTQILAYAYFPPLAEITEALAENGDMDARQGALALSLFESGSITATSDGNGSGMVRLILTLAE
jgi:hypothetical protein